MLSTRRVHAMYSEQQGVEMAISLNSSITSLLSECVGKKHIDGTGNKKNGLVKLLYTYGLISH